MSRKVGEVSHSQYFTALAIVVALVGKNRTGRRPPPKIGPLLKKWCINFKGHFSY
jgi:hypothetical protein